MPVRLTTRERLPSRADGSWRLQCSRDTAPPTRTGELEEIRAELNQKAHGRWGVLLLPAGWVAVRGSSTVVCADSASRLRELIFMLELEARDTR